jgi:hypothetical protein
MIADSNEYEKALEELKYLTDWLTRLEQEQPGPEKGLTKAGIRTMIARLHRELAIYEGSLAVEREPTS